MSYPPWVVLHVPHDSTTIPPQQRNQFVLDDSALEQELIRMTDHFTLALFNDPASQAQVVRAPVSRLVVDVERFDDDANEPMAERGMGAVYTATSLLTPLRRPLTAAERIELMQRYYYPHHALLEQAVTRAIEQYGRCHLIDCHSFPGSALPYEKAAASTTRPDICIGTDPFHTSDGLAEAYRASFAEGGWQTSLNDPFAGALVPASRYRQDARVSAVMVEVNRALYIDEDTATRRADFKQTAERIRQCCMNANGACTGFSE